MNAADVAVVVIHRKPVQVCNIVPFVIEVIGHWSASNVPVLFFPKAGRDCRQSVFSLVHGLVHILVHVEWFDLD